MNPIMIQTRHMESVSLYSEARVEYLKQLAMWIIPPLVEFFRNEYELIKLKENRVENVAMAGFQKFCAEVPKWNQDVIDANVATVLDNCRCDYVEELMTAVFIAHTKMLTAIRVNSKNKKLQITLPKLDHFLHRVYIECARSFWKSPYIFSDECTPIERQKNILQAESMCTEALSGAVRSLLPVKSILKDYLDDDDGGADEPATETVAEPEEEEEADMEPVESVPAPVPTPLSSPLSAPLPAPAATPVPAAAAAPVPAAAAAPVPAPLPAPVAVPILSPIRTSELKTLEKSSTVTITKTDAEPGAITHNPSNHMVNHIESIPSITVNKSVEDVHTNTIRIETEPVVHFTPYDTVYDDTSINGSEIRYSPKISIEDKPSSTWGFEDIGPKLTIHESELGSIESIDLEPTVVQPPTHTNTDIDMPLTDSSDYLELN